MRVYERVVIDMVTGDVVEEEWRHHDGPAALCKGPDIKFTPPPSRPPPPLPPPPVLEETREQKRQNYLEELMKQMRRGRTSTLLTGGAGVTGKPTLGLPSLVPGQTRTILGG